MPKLGRICGEDGCHVIGPAPYCPLHSRPRARRPSSTRRGYNAAWRRQRARVLQHSPRCEDCGAKATEVHHVKAIRAGGRHDEVNLRALCTSCHSRRTATSQPRDAFGSYRREGR